MDVIWIEDFLTVVEEGGFSRAADRRHVTQSALSRRIRSLEEWVGTPLFERKTHTLTLTPAGESFRAVAEDILRRLTVGRDEALQAARLKTETLYFAGTHALSQTFFPEWIRTVDAARAGAAIQLVSSNFAGCEKLLLDARAHFVLAHYHPSLVTLFNSNRTERIELDKDVLVPVCAPGEKKRVNSHKKTKGAPRYVLPGSSDEPLPYLSYHPGSGVGRIVNAFLAEKERAAHLRPTFSAPVTLLVNLARDGKGITWAPLSLIQKDLATGSLVKAGTGWDIEISICLYRTRPRLTKVAEHFWSEIKNRSGLSGANKDF